MADNLATITSDQLERVTTAKDTDLVTLGINNDFVSMTLGNLKEVLGINALNTKKIASLTLTSTGGLSARGTQYIAYDSRFAYLRFCFDTTMTFSAGDALCTLPIQCAELSNISTITRKGGVYAFDISGNKLKAKTDIPAGDTVEVSAIVLRA